MPYRISAYVRLLTTLRELGFAPRPVADFMRSSAGRDAFLRHDVDRRPAMAVQLAEREAQAGVRASYYFRCDRMGRFPEEACRRIAALGHETGYHYEDLSRHGGDRVAALAFFRRNLATFRQLAPCATVSMHGSPFSRHDNRQLLDELTIAESGLLGDVSFSLAGCDILYFTDAGGRWNDPRINRRDRMGLMPARVDPLDRPSMEQLLRQNSAHRIGFNLHPERWVEGPLQYVIAATSDHAAALAKMILRATIARQ